MRSGNRFPGIYAISVFMMCLFFFDGVFSQDEAAGEEKGFFILDFNVWPDTLLINDLPAAVYEDSVLTLDPGMYTFRAAAACYSPVERTVEILPKRVKRVILKFEHLSTPESRRYSLMRYVNYFYSSIGIIGSAFVENGPKFVLPLSILGLSQHFIWNGGIRKGFDFCTGEYSGSEYTVPGLRFFAGLTSELFGEAVVETRSVDTRTFYASITYRIVWDARERSVFRSSSSLLSGYGLTVGLEKSLTGLISVTASGSFYPFTEIELYRDDQTRFFNASGSYEHRTVEPLLRFNLDVNFDYFESLNQEWSASIGGYFSNPISGSVEFPATMPNLILLQDSTHSKVYEYKFSSAGLRFGISTKYTIAEDLSLYFKYYFYTPYSFESLGIDEKSFFFTVDTGVYFRL